MNSGRLLDASSGVRFVGRQVDIGERPCCNSHSLRGITTIVWLERYEVVEVKINSKDAPRPVCPHVRRELEAVTRHRGA